jgi:hypothetical protein
MAITSKRIFHILFTDEGQNASYIKVGAKSRNTKLLELGMNQKIRLLNIKNVKKREYAIFCFFTMALPPHIL